MFEKLAHHFQEGGWGMYGIAVCSIFIFAIAIERIQFLYFKASISKDAFVQAMRLCAAISAIGSIALALFAWVAFRRHPGSPERREAPAVADFAA